MRLSVFIIAFLFLWVGAQAQTLIDSFAISKEVIIHFDSDSHDIPDSSMVILTEFAKEFSLSSKSRVNIEAHTDDVGSMDYNLTLSKQRKTAVEKMLLDFGVPDSLISSHFFGEQKRLSLKTDEDSRQQNRRAVVQLVIPKKYGYLKGTVVNELDDNGIQADVVLDSKFHREETTTDSAGNFQVLAPMGDFVILEVVAHDHFIQEETIKVTMEQLKKPVVIPLRKAEIGKTFTFENMLFLGNRSRMLRRSGRSLDHLTRFMFANPHICIEIKGHINRPNSGPVDIHTDHYELSVARAWTVKDHLLNHGIIEDRLLAKGYGNWQMLYPKAKDEKEQGLNRRVEIEIMSCDSTKTRKDDVIDFNERFYISAVDRNYNPVTFDRDLENFTSENVIRIEEQVYYLKEVGIDPTSFTYRDLIRARAYITDKE